VVSGYQFMEMGFTRAFLVLPLLTAIAFTGPAAADGSVRVPVTTQEPITIPLTRTIADKPAYLRVEFDKFLPDKNKHPVAARVELVNGPHSVFVGRYSFFPIEETGQRRAYRTDVTDALTTLLAKAPGGPLAVRISLVPVRSGVSAKASVTVNEISLVQ
jgi:hypothetical protein